MRCRCSLSASALRPFVQLCENPHPHTIISMNSSDVSRVLSNARCSNHTRCFARVLSYMTQAPSESVSLTKLSFPFKMYTTPQSKIHTCCQSLLSYNPPPPIHHPYATSSSRGSYTKFSSTLFSYNFLDQPFSLPSSPDDYSIDVLSDYANEHARLKAKVAIPNKHGSFYPTVLDAFLNDPKWLSKCIEGTNPLRNGMTSESLRESMWRESRRGLNCREATQFFPSKVKSFLTHVMGKVLYGQYNGSKLPTQGQNDESNQVCEGQELPRPLSSLRVLDPCAGWGDRLAGFMAGNVDFYMGCDPNSDLFNGYENLKNWMKTAGSRTNVELINSPFENLDLSDYHEYFDLVFTGPPFFDFEKYTNIEGQSIDDCNDCNDWLSDWLFPMCIKSVAALKYDGILALYIADLFKPFVFVEPLCLFMEIWSCCKYFGPVSFISGRNLHRPIWIWKKGQSKSNDDVRVAEARKVFEKEYKVLYDKCCDQFDCHK
ncbi:hypothetical protein P9112_011327 [Eukaryota sp. TZLM1-RC]